MATGTSSRERESKHLHGQMFGSVWERGVLIKTPYGCFQNRGTPKWMVYKGKTLRKWMIWGGFTTPIFGLTRILRNYPPGNEKTYALSQPGTTFESIVSWRVPACEQNE